MFGLQFPNKRVGDREERRLLVFPYEVRRERVPWPHALGHYIFGGGGF